MITYQNEENKILALVKEKVVGYLIYEKLDNNTYDIISTYVSEEYRGQKIAQKLVEMAIKKINEKGKLASNLTCSYASAYCQKNNL